MAGRMLLLGVSGKAVGNQRLKITQAVGQGFLCLTARRESVIENAERYDKQVENFPVFRDRMALDTRIKWGFNHCRFEHFRQICHFVPLVSRSHATHESNYTDLFRFVQGETQKTARCFYLAVAFFSTGRNGLLDSVGLREMGLI